MHVAFTLTKITKEEICNKMFAYSYSGIHSMERTLSVSTDKRNVLSLFSLFATARSVHFVLKNL